VSGLFFSQNSRFKKINLTPLSIDTFIDRHNGTGESDALLTAHPVYQSLAATQEKRLAAYRSLFADEIAPELLELVRNTTSKTRSKRCSAAQFDQENRGDRPSIAIDGVTPFKSRFDPSF